MTKPVLDWNRVRMFLEDKYRNLPPARSVPIILRVEDLLAKYKPHLDHGFLNGLLSGNAAQFQQRYWEMVLGQHLTQFFTLVLKTNPDGPDFQFSLEHFPINLDHTRHE